MQQRSNTFSQEKQNGEKELQLANTRIRRLDREMITLKPEIIKLYKHRKHYIEWLRDHGKEWVEINRLLAEWSHEIPLSGSNVIDVVQTRNTETHGNVDRNCMDTGITKKDNFPFLFNS